MNTFTPAIGTIDFSIRGPGARLLVAMGLLAFSACSGVGIEEEAAADGEEVTALEQPFLGSDACKDVDIRVKNYLSYAITVRSLEYYNASEGRWMTEDLTNKVVSPGAMEFWTPAFEYSENDWIYSFNVTYDHPGHNGHVYHVNTPDQTCIPGRVFLLEIQ